MHSGSALTSNAGFHGSGTLLGGDSSITSIIISFPFRSAVPLHVQEHMTHKHVNVLNLGTLLAHMSLGQLPHHRECVLVNARPHQIVQLVFHSTV